MMERLRVLITVKTYPIPSKRHDELVCTAGISDDGRLIRLYPINFRVLPYARRYRKYQWIEVDAEKHVGRDHRKESYRPVCDTLVVGERIPTDHSGVWRERRAIVLPCAAQSMEALWDAQKEDWTSLGLIKPAEVMDVVATPDDADWKPSFLEALRQERLWDDRGTTRTPPRKVPFKFRYHFRCDDERCTSHKMLIEDWEVGRLYWRLIDGGHSPEKARDKVRSKFMDTLCGPNRETWFHVGTVLAHGTWVVIGVFWPKLEPPDPQLSLFFDD